MSDFLVNLARRSAGLAPVVRARSAPVVDRDDFASATDEPVARGSVEPAEPKVSAAAPMPHPSAMSHVAPVQQPAPVVRVAAQTSGLVAQRTPAATPAPAAPAARAPAHGGDTPTVVPLAASRAAVDAAATIVPASMAVASATSAAPDITPRVRERSDEPRTIATRLETVVRHETSNAPAPTVVTIEPVERAATAVPTRAEPTPERTVHVRIGAIEIFGADAASQQPAVAAAPSATASAAAPTSPPSGFDDFAALRSYRPWAW